MAVNRLSFVDDDGTTFTLLEDKILSAFDNGTYHVIVYKDHVDGVPQSIPVTDASFTAAQTSFRELVTIDLVGVSENEYININTISLIETNGSNTEITIDNGAGKESKLITGSVSDFVVTLARSNTTINPTLTSASILALNTTPLTILPAPGAGNYYVIEEASASIDFNSAAYAAGGDLQLRYTDGTGAIVASFPEAFVEATADDARFNGQQAMVDVAINAPIVAFAATSDPTTGDSPISINLTYRIESI